MTPSAGSLGIGAPVPLPVRIIGLFAPGGRWSAFSAFLALAAQQGGTLLTGGLAFFLLGSQQYGRTASALAFLNIFVSLGSVSSTIMVYRSVLLEPHDEAAWYRIIRFARSAVLCSGLIVVLMTLGTLWVFPDLGSLKTTVPIEVAAALGFLLASVLASYQQGYVLARGETLPLLIVNLLILAVTLPVGWLLIRYFGYAGYFAALTLPLLLRGMVLYLREPGRPEEPRTGRFDRRSALLRFMLPATAANFTSFPAYWLATEILFRIPDGAAALGLITLGISVKQAPLLLATSLISSSGRSVFQAFAQGAPDMVARYRSFFRRTIAPLLAGAGGVVLVGTATMLATGSSDHLHDVGIVAAGLGIVLALETINAFVYMPINMGGAMWQSLFGITIPRDVCFGLASLVVIPLLGWPGFLAGLIALNALGIILTVVVGRRNSALAPFFTLRSITSAVGQPS